MTLLDSRHGRVTAAKPVRWLLQPALAECPVTAPIARSFAVGDRVRIERDETLYPSKGTWPEFRGRTGTAVEINVDRKRPHLTEFGVMFGKARMRPDGSLHGADIVTWFKNYELRLKVPDRTGNRMAALAAESHADGSFNGHGSAL